MIEDFYTRVGIINSNPDVLSKISEDDRNSLKGKLTTVTDNIDGDETVLKEAIEDFITTFDGLGLDEALEGVAKTRSLGLKQETKLPRQIINDATIMTLKNF